jgi:hypothetical protein
VNTARHGHRVGGLDVLLVDDQQQAASEPGDETGHDESAEAGADHLHALAGRGTPVRLI